MTKTSVSHNPHATQGDVVPMKDFRAATLAAAGAVQPTGRGRFAVESSSGQGVYSVVKVRGGYCCNCPAAKKDAECKHAVACRAWERAVEMVARHRREGRGEEFEGGALTLSLQAEAGLVDHFTGLTAEIVLLAARYLDNQGAEAVAA